MRAESLFEAARKGSRRALAQAMTLLESRRAEDQKDALDLLHLVLPYAGGARRVAISGIPGVGKSSFINALGLEVLTQDSSVKIGVLALDPSSPLSHGSILGDKTRMKELDQHPSVFIRPSPSLGGDGGIGLATHEMISLMEACGYGLILVETVGAGQGEYLAADLTDLFLVLHNPHTGDELQAVKKGMLEMADMLVINKADGDLAVAAQLAHGHLKSAIGILLSRTRVPPVLMCSSTQRLGLPELWDKLREIWDEDKSSGRLVDKRSRQLGRWARRSIVRELGFRLQEREADGRFVVPGDVMTGAVPVRRFAGAKAAKLLGALELS